MTSDFFSASGAGPYEDEYIREQRRREQASDSDQPPVKPIVQGVEQP